MSLKKLFSNTRGEAASLILIVSMIIATLGVITGSRVVEQQIRTSTQAQSTLGITLYPNTMNFPITEGQSIPFQIELWGTRAKDVTEITITANSYTGSDNVLMDNKTKSMYIKGPFIQSPYTGNFVAYTNLHGVASAGGTYGKVDVVAYTTDDITKASTSIQYSVVKQPTPTPTITPVPLACSISAVDGPYIAGQKYTLNGTASGGSGSYIYAWTIFKIDAPTFNYGEWTNPTGQSTQWTVPTNTNLGTTAVAQLSVVDSKNNTALCQKNMQVNFTPPTAPPTNTPIPPTLTNTPIPPPATNTPVPPATATPSSPRNGVWEFTMNCANGSYSYTRSTKGQYIGPGYCVDIWINDGTVYSGCGTWPGSQSFSGPYNQLYFAPNVYTLRGKVWNADRTQLLVDESLIKSCVEPTVPAATNTPTNTPKPTTPPVVTRPDVIIKSATHSFNTLGGMTLITVFENLGTAAVNYVGAHAMNVEIKDGSQVVCETTNLAGIAGLAPQTTKSHTTYFPTNIYSSCSSFTPTPGKTYNVTLYVDPPTGSSNNGLIAELDETNNTKSFNFTQPSSPAVTVPAATNTPTAIPLPLPDLIVKSTTHTFDTSANLTMVAGIQNVGKAKVNSGNHVLNVEVKDPVTSPTTVLCETVSAVDIAGLAPQAIYSHTVLFTSEIYNKCPTFSPIPGKTYKVTLYIDPPTKTDKNGTVLEAIETNNSRSFNFVQPGGSPATNTPVPPTVPPTAPPATTSTPSTTTTDVNMDITIINPQPNFTIWGTAQEMGVANKISAIKCNIGDSTKPLVTIKCPQLKRGKTYEFIALAKAKLPNAQTIQSDKNTYLIPGTSTITPQSQKKTLTLPGNTQPPTNTPPAQATATPTATTAPVQTTATPTATATPNPDYNFQVTLPAENSQHYLPLQLEYRGSISGAASGNTARIDLKLYKYPINTNIPLLETRISSFTTTNNSIGFSGVLTGANVNTVGDYVLQLIPYGQTGTIIGNHKEVRFQIVDTPAPPTATPTNTPVPGTPTPTPLRAICQDLLVSGDSAQKYDVIFLPSGYSDYNTFEADAKEAVSYYRNAVPDALNAKYNYKIFTNLEKGYDVVTCRSTTNNSTYPCWSTILAKDAMRNCNGDAYVIIAYTPKPSEDATKATQALNQFGGVKAVTLGKNRGEMLVLRYDLSQLTNIVSGSIVGGGGNSVSSLLRSVWENVLQKFR